MPTGVAINGISTPTVYTSYIDQPIYCNLKLPLTRQSQLDKRPISITGVALYLSGNGASRTLTAGVGAARSSSFSVANSGSASLTSTKSLTANALDTATFTSTTVGIYLPSGSYHFARAANSGNAIVGFSGGAGQSLVGTFDYVQVPTAPYDLSLSTSGGNITATWTAPTDNGGSSVTGYSIEYADNELFTGSTTVTSATTSKVFAVSPGSDYYVRVAAQNSIYSWAEHPTSVWSDVASTSAGISGFRWDGSQEVPLTVAMRWDGSQEVPLTVAMRWDGSQEVALT